ncbi:hypothetical protein ACNKHN_22220 [Shigella flexneri]
MKHAKAINALQTRPPTLTSVWSSGYEAPVMLAYSARNRSASIRIPVLSSPKTRRSPRDVSGPAANPYLCFAAR